MRMGNVLAVIQLDDLVSQESQMPASMSFRCVATGQSGDFCPHISVNLYRPTWPVGIFQAVQTLLLVVVTQGSDLSLIHI